MRKVIAFLFVLSTASSAFTGGTFRGLGDLPGADFYSEAYGISGDGRVVVGAAQSVPPEPYFSPATEAFYWSEASGMVALGDFPLRALQSSAWSASADGSVIAGQGRPDWPACQAFRWTLETGLVGLGHLPTNFSYSSYARDISGDGSVVVGSSYGMVGNEGFIWTEATGMVGLGHLPGGDGSYYYSTAVAVSADGKTVIGEDNSTGYYKPYTWTAETGMQPLDDYGGDAKDISGNGFVVLLDENYGSYSKAVRWTKAEGRKEIGRGQVYATNWDGSVIVGSNEQKAFIWSWKDGMRDLQTYLQSLSCPGLAGWQLIAATDVSYDGTAIAGYGTNPSGKREAWIAVIPKDELSEPLLEAAWRFDETSGTVANDSVGNSHGEIKNGALWTDGVVSSALSFDGADDYVQITDYKGITGDASRTCCAWIKTSTASKEILGWGGSGAGEKWQVGLTDSGKLCLSVNRGSIYGTANLADGNWHHIAVAFNSDGSPTVSDVVLYVDGRLEEIGGLIDQIIQTAYDEDVRIGFGSQGCFNGLIDEVRIYNAALSLNEVRESAVVPLGVAFSVGSGSISDPYQIKTSQELYYLSVRPELWDKSFVLMNDIDLSVPGAIQPKSIGSDYEHPFKGNFDGNNYVIKGLLLKTENEYGGLFGRLGDYNTSTIVKNLTLLDTQITALETHAWCVGVLAGHIQSAEIFNCNILNAKIHLDSGDYGYYVGLVAGMINNSTLQNVKCTGSIESNCISIVGGIAGSIAYSSFFNCSFEGSLTGTIQAGGFAGSTSRNLVAKQCWTKATINTSNMIAGGFFGHISMDNNSTQTEITDCYSESNVTGTEEVGGFVGRIEAQSPSTLLFKNCYCAGLVTGITQAGGFAGKTYFPENVDYVACFWNSEINPGLQGTDYSDNGLIAENTARMQLLETYLDAGWDFEGEIQNGRYDIWVIDTDSYPRFAGFPGGGSGTESDPYLIFTKDHLLHPMLQSGSEFQMHFKLMADIDFEEGPCPMLCNDLPFEGTFDGNNKTIANFILTPSTTYMIEYGLFRYAFGNGYIKNLTLLNPKIYAQEGLKAGFLVANSTTLIENCHVINAYGYCSNPYNPPTTMGIDIGGIVGSNGGIIRNCSFTGYIKAPRSAGIAVSNLYDGAMIDNCTASVNLLGESRVGGIVCDNYCGYINNCRTDGVITATGRGTDYNAACGGIAGENRSAIDLGNGVINECYSNCNVATNCRYAGGLVGSSWGGLIKDCYATGSVKGFGYIGGLVGSIQTSTDNPAMGVIENCYATGNVSGDNRVGGFAGENGSSIIRNCYATGNVTGTALKIGGFAGTVYFYPYDGYGTAIVDRCYSIGKVTGSTQTGGFIGRRLNESVVTNCYWNTQTSGWTTSQGGTGRTTAQMQTQSTFAGWDFASLWYQGDYPVFRREISPLQARLDAAIDGDLIAVEPGIYDGRLYFKGKNVNLFSNDPATAILRGRGVGPVITFKGTENETCMIDGFTIESGNAQFPGGGGIYGGPTAAATAAVRNCIVQKNRTSDYGGGIGGLKGQISNCIIRDNEAKYGGGISWCQGIIENCLIISNKAGTAGNALHLCNGQIKNCTIVSNDDFAVSQVNSCTGSFTNCILSGQDNTFENCTGPVSYSCYPSALQDSNISADPMFIDPANEDYHLSADSPCIDAGDPASDYSLEPLPNGARINMGAYGNTPEAQISPNGGLVLRGFEIISKVRTGRTQFQYVLAVKVRNTNPYDMNNVTVKLIDADDAVISVVDDQVLFSCIEGNQTITSTDVFIITVDRLRLIDSAKLTCELTWQTQAGPQLKLVAMLLDPDDTGGDISGDGDVDFEDFAIMSKQWQTAPAEPSADIALPFDDFVGIEDLLYLAENWLQ